MTVNQHISRNTSLDRREHWRRRPEALGLSPGWYFTFHHMLHLALSVQSPQNMTHNISITHRIYSLRGTTGFTGTCMLMLVNRCLSNSVVSGLARHAKRPCVWVLVETCFFTTSFTSLWCMIRYRLCEFFQRYCWMQNLSEHSAEISQLQNIQLQWNGFLSSLMSSVLKMLKIVVSCACKRNSSWLSALILS